MIRLANFARLRARLLLLGCAVFLSAGAAAAAEPAVLMLEPIPCGECEGAYEPVHRPWWRRILAPSRFEQESGYGPRRGQLPRGRRYLNGRYFGNFNNRFYGPQYGYF